MVGEVRYGLDLAAEDLSGEVVSREIDADEKFK